MATIINQATLTYTCGATTASVTSNLASTEWTAPITAEKRVLQEAYREGDVLTYLISLQNGGEAPIENLVITDDLGAYTPAGAAAPVVPLTFVGAATLYIDGTFSEDVTAQQTENGVQFTLPPIPAGADALLLYQAAVNGFAPLSAGSEITNSAAVGDTDPVTVTATVPVASYADVSIEKEMSPNPITDGGTLSVTFTVENRGNAEATDLSLVDVFPLPLSDVTVAVNCAPVTDFTFEGSRLTLPSEGSTQTTLSVPAATFAQDETTGAVTVTPGMLTVTVTGTV